MAKRRSQRCDSQAIRFPCDGCEKTFSRDADLKRHKLIHAPDKEKYMHYCDEPGCKFKTLQKSNLVTHKNTHTGARPHKCPEEECSFASGDPGCLTRHRREIHGYMPKGGSPASQTSETKRKATRGRRRYVPYPGSSSNNSSVSPSDPGPASSSTSLSDDHLEGSTNKLETYGTTISPLTLADDSDFVPNSWLEDAPLDPELLRPSEAPVLEYPQPKSEHGAVDTTYTAVQPVCDMAVTEEVFNNFLSKFPDDWQFTSSYLHSPIASHGVEDVSALPNPLNAVEDAYLPTFAAIPGTRMPTGASLPPNQVQYPVDSAPSGHYGPTSVSLNSYLPQSDLSTTLDMAASSQVVYPQNVDPSSVYGTYAGTMNAHLPTSSSLPRAYYNMPTRTSLPSNEVHYPVNNTPSEYHGPNNTSLNAYLSQPDLFTAPGVTARPQAIYPPNYNSGYVYTTYAGANGFPMQGLYVS